MQRPIVFIIETQSGGALHYLQQSDNGELSWTREARAAITFAERVEAERFATTMIDGEYLVSAMPKAWLH
jgi:hypothetical protein